MVKKMRGLEEAVLWRRGEEGPNHTISPNNRAKMRINQRGWKKAMMAMARAPEMERRSHVEAMAVQIEVHDEEVWRGLFFFWFFFWLVFF